MAFETLLCGLALYRVFSGGTVFSSGRQLIKILVRDSVFYFLMYVTCGAYSGLLLIVANQNVRHILDKLIGVDYWEGTLSVSSIAC